MFLQIIQIERQKLSKRPMFWIEWALIIATVILFFGLFYGAQTADFSGTSNVQVEGDLSELADLLIWPLGATIGFEAISLVGTFLLIILTGALVAQEYSWNSFQLWLSRGVPRSILLLAKLLIASLVTLLFVSTAVLTGAIISAIFSLVELGELPFNTINWPQLGLSILLITISLLPYITLTFLLAVLSRSTVMAIGGALAVAVIIEPVLGQIGGIAGGQFAEIVQYLPANLGQSISQAIHEIPQTAVNANLLTMPAQPLSIGTAVFISTIYILIFSVGSILLFQHQDLGG